MADAQSVDDDIIIEDTAKAGDKLVTSDSELEKLRLELEKSRKNEDKANIALVNERKRSSETAGKLVNETNNRLGAEEVAIHNGIAAATQEAENLEQQVVAAQTEGKFAEAAKLTRQLASAQVKIDDWGKRKTQLESYKASQAEIAKNRPAEVADPYAHLSSPTRAWIERNPKFRTDNTFNKLAQAYASEAEDQGFAIDTPDYFKYVDNKLAGKTTTTNDDAGDDAPVRVQSSRTSKVASATPPSRNTSAMNNGGSTKSDNRLTPAEAEMAVLSYPKLPQAEAQKKYLENKRVLIGEGKIQGNA